MAESAQQAEGGVRVKGVIHVLVACAFVVLFWNLPVIDPITPIGMRVIGVFTAMVYLWSTVGTLWPSIAALVMFAIAGTGGDAGFAGVFLNAMGNSNVLLTMFAMILFGAFDDVGCTKYIAKWILSRKLLEGRPYVLLSLVFLTAFLMSPLVGPVPCFLMMWPICLRITDVSGLVRADRAWKFFFVGLFMAVAFGQPLFPFKGSALVGVSAFESIMASSQNPVSMPYLPYMLTCIADAFMVFALFFVYMKVTRVDVGKLKSITPEVIQREMPLPAMNFQQKAFMVMLPIFLACVLLPAVLPSNPICDALNSIGALGVTIIMIVVMIAIEWNGKPLLQLKKVVSNQFQWGVYFMVAAGVYGAGLLGNKAMGIRAWLVQVLNPVLGGHPEPIFMLLLIAFAIVITTFAHNGAMAVVIMPVAVSFAAQMNIDAVPVAIMLVLSVHVAFLSPAASVPSAMAWGNRDIYSPKEILSIGLPVTVAAILVYTFVSYPIVKMLCAALGA